MLRKISAISVLLILFASVVFAAENRIAVIGEVVGMGDAEMKTLDRWMTVTGKPYPLIEGSELRTFNGQLAITLRDGTRLEVDNNTVLLFEIAKEGHVMQLKSGGMNVHVPRGIPLLVKTSFAEVYTPYPKVPQNVPPVIKGTISYVAGGVCNVGVGVNGEQKGNKVATFDGLLLVRKICERGEIEVGKDETLFVEWVRNQACLCFAWLEPGPAFAVAPTLTPAALIGLGGLITSPYWLIRDEVRRDNRPTPSTP